MKKRYLILAVTLCTAAMVALTGCGGQESAAGSGAESSATAASGTSFSGAKAFYLQENSGELEADVEAKEDVKEIKDLLGTAKEESGDLSGKVPQEGGIYIEWDGGDDSYYGDLYKLEDGSTLVTVQAANGEDGVVKYYTANDGSVYDGIQAVLQRVASK